MMGLQYGTDKLSYDGRCLTVYNTARLPKKRLFATGALANLFDERLERPSVSKGMLGLIPPIDADAEPFRVIASLRDVVVPTV